MLSMRLSCPIPSLRPVISIPSILPVMLHILPIPCALVFERLLRRGACLTLVDKGNAPLIVHLHMALTQQALQQAGAQAQAVGASQRGNVLFACMLHDGGLRWGVVACK